MKISNNYATFSVAYDLWNSTTDTLAFLKPTKKNLFLISCLHQLKASCQLTMIATQKYVPQTERIHYEQFFKGKESK